MHRGSEIPRSIRPPKGAQQQCGWPQKHAYGKAGYGASGEIEDSRIAVVLATLYKMAWKWPIWLQAKMMRATLGGLPQGLSYGCALGTIVGVEAGYSHTVADMTCTQNLQDHFEQAVSCSYETVLLGHRSAQPQLIAASTINVAKAGQRYVEMLAEVVARLVKDGHGRPAAKVCLLVIAQGYLGIAMKISATMMKRGHLKETAKVSRYLVAAGHSDFKKCLDGQKECKDTSPHPNVCRMARRWTRLLSLAAFLGGVVALHYFPKHRAEISDSISETGRRKKRQVAHHLGNARRSIGSHSIQDSESDSEDELGSPSSSSQVAAESRSQHDSHLGTDPRQGPMLRGSNAIASHRGVQHGRQQQAYSSDEDDVR
ncbi:TPA: hypothetical protein ACH3X1_011492 [Trebouxia sp. C0004]